MFILGCDGARRRDSPLHRPPRRGRPPSFHGPAAGKASASARGGRAGACNSGRATRPVALALVTPRTTAMPALYPWGAADCRTQQRPVAGRQGQSSIGHALCMAEAPLALARAALLLQPAARQASSWRLTGREPSTESTGNSTIWRSAS